MTILHFNQGGWEVMTASWTVAAKPNRTVRICYGWGAGSYGSAGIAAVDIDIRMPAFAALVARGGVVDLRGYQG